MSTASRNRNTSRAWKPSATGLRVLAGTTVVQTLDYNANSSQTLERPAKDLSGSIDAIREVCRQTLKVDPHDIKASFLAAGALTN